MAQNANATVLEGRRYGIAVRASAPRPRGGLGKTLETIGAPFSTVAVNPITSSSLRVKVWAHVDKDSAGRLEGGAIEVKSMCSILQHSSTVTSASTVVSG